MAGRNGAECEVWLDDALEDSQRLKAAADSAPSVWKTHSRFSLGLLVSV